MTETEWLIATDPRSMLEFLRCKVCDRKLRLFACACARRVWHLLSDGKRQEVVNGERIAEGQPVQPIVHGAPTPGPDSQSPGIRLYAGFAASYTAVGDAFLGACRSSSDARIALGKRAGLEAQTTQTSVFHAMETVRASERLLQAAMLRDILGPLPFRSIPVNPDRLISNKATVPAIAQRIYDERAFHDLPFLADALEEAGCTDPDILAHCRGGGEHVRGCWIVDLILGKS